MMLSCKTASNSPGTALEGVEVRLLRADDGDALGALMWDSYRGTIDDEYVSLAQALADAHDTLGGKWGPVIDEACLAAVDGGRVVAAVIAVRDADHDLSPLLAFALTDPAWQKRGIGRALIEDCIARLCSLGISELHLAVTPGNPAQRLYERIGFNVVAAPDS